MKNGDQELAELIGQRIKQLRHQRGWYQIDLEAHLDGFVKRATLSDYETGRRLPSLPVLQRLADAFEVEIAALLVLPSRSMRHSLVARMLGCSEAQVKRILGTVAQDLPPEEAT